MAMRVTNLTKGQVLAHRAEEARTMWRRFLGWMGKRSLHEGEGLHLVPCNAIHTFFMRFPIDVLFLDASGAVVRCVTNLRPWRMTPACPGARSILELPSGTIASHATQVGDKLAFEGVV